MTSTLHRGQEVRPGKQEGRKYPTHWALAAGARPGRKRNEDTRAGNLDGRGRESLQVELTMDH